MLPRSPPTAANGLADKQNAPLGDPPADWNGIAISDRLARSLTLLDRLSSAYLWNTSGSGATMLAPWRTGPTARRGRCCAAASVTRSCCAWSSPTSSRPRCPISAYTFPPPSDAHPPPPGPRPTRAPGTSAAERARTAAADPAPRSSAIMDLASPRRVDHDVNFMIDARW